MLTAIASNAYLDGYNVMHLVWEDTVKDIHLKVIAHQYNKKMGYDHNNGLDIRGIQDTLTVEDVTNVRPQKNNYAFVGIKKAVTTLKDIEEHILKYIREKGYMDLLVLDYADLISYKKDGHVDNQYANDIYIYRGIERLAQKYNIAIWTASQINRSGSSTSSVDTGTIGGSIKKIQASPLVIGLSRTMEQKQFGCATITINKNRTGPDGFEFKDVIFNNGKMIIDLTETILCEGFEK